MSDTASRILVFRIQPKRYTLAGIASVTLHGMLALSAFGWARQSVWLEPARDPMARSAPTAVHYVVMLPPPAPGATERPESAPGSPESPKAVEGPASTPRQSGAPVSKRSGLLVVSAVLTAALPDPAPATAEPGIQAQEIAPGEVASIAGAGDTPIDYARVDQRDQIRVGDIDPEGPDGRTSPGFGDQHGSSRVAELVGPAAAACPALRRADTERDRQVIVSIGFDVDAHGMVDPRSLHVVQSPAKPQTEHRVYGHMYAVAIGAKVDRALPDAEPVYDSLVTRDVRQHIVALQFHPALRDGRPIRSSVLVSCQAS